MFRRRQVELVAGEVRTPVHGRWPGVVVVNAVAALRAALSGSEWLVTSETLVLDDLNAPVPDVWVRRRDAVSAAKEGSPATRPGRRCS